MIYQNYNPTTGRWTYQKQVGAWTGKHHPTWAAAAAEVPA